MIENWEIGETLDSKHKEFRWSFDDTKGLSIKRVFKDDKEILTQFSIGEIEKIIEYTNNNGTVSLSNNIEKIETGIEQDGLGKFVYESLGKNITDAQSVTHLTSIFVSSEIYRYRGKLENMEFELYHINWKDKLNQKMYKSKTNQPFKAVINHITFSVENLEASISFYEKALNAKLLAKGERLAYFDLNGIWFALNLEEGLDRKAISQSYTHIAFEVNENELRERFESLFEIGADIEHGRNRNVREGKSLYVKDPDGHLIEFHTSNLEERLAYYREERDDIEVYV